MNSQFMRKYIDIVNEENAKIDNNEESTLTVNDNGDKEWRNANGELHRTDGPARILSWGSNQWWLNGKRHREDGPAIEDADGTKEWWVNGERHREDGPAVRLNDGELEYWLHNKQLTMNQFAAQYKLK